MIVIFHLHFYRMLTHREILEFVPICCYGNVLSCVKIKMEVAFPWNIYLSGLDYFEVG